MTEWQKGVWMALELILVSLIVSVLVGLTYLAKTAQSNVAAQDARRELMEEFREFNSFNNKVVYTQDVISLILKTRGEKCIKVIQGSNSLYWVEKEHIAAEFGVTLNYVSSYTTDYTAEDIADKLSLNHVYKAELVYHGNGDIIGVICTRGTMSGETFIPG